MSRYIIIVAGGKGTRMNSETLKQFALLAGKPLLMHTIEKFYSADQAMTIIVVLPEKEIMEWKNLCAMHRFTVPHQITNGGDTRFQSVKNGLELVKEKCIVGIHDGARPFASESLIQKCFSEAEKNGNAVPCIPIQESIRDTSGNENKIADRNSFVIIQTPQCFDSEILKAAFLVPYQPSFTDDASVAEVSGIKINLVEGERENMKITFPYDLQLAEAMMSLRG